MGVRRWIVALDESGMAEKIVQWMRAFPHPRNTVVTLVHVLGPLEIPDAIGATGRQLLLQQQEAMCDTALGWAQRLLKETFARVEVITRAGVPSQELLRLIREYEPDLVISGRGWFYQAAGFGLGNVSHRLVAYAPCSLLLVPGRVQRGGGVRVMLATVGSADAQRAARVLATLPELCEIIVASVARPLGAEKLVLDRFHDVESRKMQAEFLRHRFLKTLWADLCGSCHPAAHYQGQWLLGQGNDPLTGRLNNSGCNSERASIIHSGGDECLSFACRSV